jgi:hypothetical protein
VKRCSFPADLFLSVPEHVHVPLPFSISVSVSLPLSTIISCFMVGTDWFTLFQAVPGVRQGSVR